jgi:hypothetical protein
MQGLYYFFTDELVAAWRMCGLAGNICMELGLHSQEDFRHVLEFGQQREEAVALLCSVIVLDRQWSAATGLPTHFHESSFDKSLTSKVSGQIYSLPTIITQLSRISS